MEPNDLHLTNPESFRDFDSFDNFDPCQYIEKNFPAEIDLINRFIIDKLANSYAQYGSTNPLIYEIGAGPSIPYLCASARTNPKIICGDISETNIEFLSKFKTGELDHKTLDIFYPYIELLLKLEGTPSSRKDIAARLEQTRSAIGQVLKTNIFDIISYPNEKGHKVSFDIITSHFCLESATDNAHQFEQGCENMISVLKNGGLLVISAMGGAACYTVGDKLFPAYPIRPVELTNLLESKGMTTIEISEEPFPDIKGLDQIIFYVGKKLD